MRKIRVFILVAMVILSGSIHGWARELNAQSFAEQLEFEGTAFHLQGLGLKTQFFIKVFVAGFYTAEALCRPDLLAGCPKRIEVAYLYPIPGKKLAAETRKNMILNTTSEEFNSIRSRVELMESFYVDLKPGDRYAISYLPERGTYFTYNGKVMGLIEGSDFAKALFAVWIGENPISQLLKRNLLGSKKDGIKI